MCIYNRLSAVSRSVKEELNACQVTTQDVVKNVYLIYVFILLQVLAAVSVHALSRSFDISVERKKGVNLELIYDEISREDRLKEEQQKKRKIKKRKKRNEKKDLKTFNCNLSLVPGKCYENDSNVICDEIEPNVIEVISNVERSRSASVENLGVKMDEMSITSCRSCNYGDAGYSSECHNDCILSNNISSRTSSIVSTPEGSEMACSDSCCKETAHVETFLTLEQMLNEETGDTEYGIPDEEIEEFRSRDDIKQKREELREKLLRNFNELRAKCCLNTRKQK